MPRDRDGQEQTCPDTPNQKPLKKPGNLYCVKLINAIFIRRKILRGLPGSTPKQILKRNLFSKADRCCCLCSNIYNPNEHDYVTEFCCQPVFFPNSQADTFCTKRAPRRPSTWEVLSGGLEGPLGQEPPGASAPSFSFHVNLDLAWPGDRRLCTRSAAAGPKMRSRTTTLRRGGQHSMKNSMINFELFRNAPHMQQSTVKSKKQSIPDCNRSDGIFVALDPMCRAVNAAVNEEHMLM